MHKKIRQYNLQANESAIFEAMEILDQSIAAEVADKLLEIQAIRLQPEKPFTWASGWKSPIYCDNRLSPKSEI
jgi:orotate phosphoribosyltransferase